MVTDPIQEPQSDPMVGVAVAAARSVVNNARALGLTWQLRPATVALDSPDEANIEATLDGDVAVLSMVSLVGPLLEGQRVMTMIIPPAGMFIIGTIAYDDWHLVGDTDQPTFNSGWSNVGSPFADAAFRLTPDGHVELAGLVSPTGTFTGPTTIFTLPDEYAPTHTRVFPRANNPSSGTAPTGRTILINSDGEVQLTNFTAATNPGVISLDGIYFARDTDSP